MLGLRSIIPALLVAVAISTEVTYPECHSFRKNGVPPVTSKATCRTACETAEGLSGDDWKGTPGAGQCQCLQQYGNRVICEDANYGRWTWLR
eukprot:Skav227870  [mRNA]  locus=scaffold2896:44110:44385:+ [translate_table: standard]